jgi:hypothetical protein
MDTVDGHLTSDPGSRESEHDVTMADMVANVWSSPRKLHPKQEISQFVEACIQHVHLIGTVAGVRDEWKIRSEYCDTC